jgi:hypothetical protein
MGPGDKKKKDECSPFDNCMKNKQFKGENKGNQSKKENVPGAAVPKKIKYDEKVGYQAATAYYDEPASEKAEQEGSNMSKSERDAKYGAYKTRQR